MDQYRDTERQTQPFMHGETGEPWRQHPQNEAEQRDIDCESKGWDGRAIHGFLTSCERRESNPDPLRDRILRPPSGLSIAPNPSHS